MATTTTDVANIALLKLGEELIADLDSDTGRSGLAVAEVFVDTRNEVFRTLPWACLVKRANLVVSETTNYSEFDLIYTLPADCLRALEISVDSASQNIIYRIEGPDLVTDEVDANLRYVAAVETPATWDATLLEAIAIKIATKIAYRITGNPNIAAAFLQEYIMTLAIAAKVAMTEGYEDSTPFITFLQGVSPGVLFRTNPVEE